MVAPMMHNFLWSTGKVLTQLAKDEFPSDEEVLECVLNFNSAVYSVVCHAVVPLLKMPEEEKKAIRQQYRQEYQNPSKELREAFDGLDFDMSDALPGINPDS
jgi:hypothetical protein